MIRSLARHEKYIQTCLVCRELRCHRLRSLNHPKVEDFTLYDEIVIVADTLMNLLDGILRITRNDTVHKSTINSTSLLKPSLEALTKIPKIDILINTLLKFLTIKEDKLARKDDQSLILVAIEMIISAIKKLGKLARI